jgi:hypothetical protein
MVVIIKDNMLMARLRGRVKLFIKMAKSIMDSF